MGTFVAFLRGGFAGGIKMIVGRFGIWGAVIVGTIALLQKLSSEWQKKQNGQYNWIDAALDRLDLFRARINLTIAEFRWLYQFMALKKDSLIPSWAQDISFNPVTNAVDSLKKVGNAVKNHRQGTGGGQTQPSPSQPSALPSYATKFGGGVPVYQLPPPQQKQSTNVTVINQTNGSYIKTDIVNPTMNTGR